MAPDCNVLVSDSSACMTCKHVWMQPIVRFEPSLLRYSFLTQAVEVQEFCTGGSLRQALQGNMFGERLQQRWVPICSMLEGIASGMQHVHSKRICHGDLNPNNVLLQVLLLVSTQPLP